MIDLFFHNFVDPDLVVEIFFKKEVRTWDVYFSSSLAKMSEFLFGNISMASVILWYTALWGVFCLPSSLTLISAFLLSSSSRGSLFFHYAGMSTGFCLMHLLYLSQHLPEYHFARVCHQLLWYLECETPHIDVRISLQPHYHES